MPLKRTSATIRYIFTLTTLCVLAALPIAIALTIPLPVREGLGEGSALSNSSRNWNNLSAQVAAPFAIPTPGSLEEFIIEHYWAYTRCRNGRTSEFRVAHDPWHIAPATNVTWNCHIASNYDSPLGAFLTSAPASAIIAAGSPVEVFLRRTI